MVEEERTTEAESSGAVVFRRIGRLIRSYWATTLLIASVIVAAVATGALWNGVTVGRGLYDDVAYGLPALEDGRWWTFLAGMFFAPRFVVYVPILVLLVIAASAYERRVGHVRTLIVAIGGQALAALATALVLSLFDDSGWSWAVDLGERRDLGISAGGFALVGALTAVMQPVWRRRVRVGGLAYALAMVLNSGLLWDVEHLIGFAVGVGVGPLMVGRAPTASPISFGKRTQRSMVALIVALIAISSLVEGMFAGNGGPFHTSAHPFHPSGVTLGLVVGSLVLIALADGLRRGRRLAWIAVVVLTAVALVVVALAEPSGERTADLVLIGGQLMLLLVTVRAFGARIPRRSARHVGRRLIWVLVGLFMYTVIGFRVLRNEFTPRAQWSDIIGEFFARLVGGGSNRITANTEEARLFAASVGWIWTIAIVVTLVGLLYSTRRPQIEPEQDRRLRELLSQHRSSNIEWMLTWDGITVWFATDGRTAIGYKIVGSVALCLADPVGPIDDREAALREFDEFCFDHGWIPCLFAASQTTADIAPHLGWKSVQVAEDSVMSLDDVEFRGKAWQNVRTALNKAGREDIELISTTWSESTPVVTDQLRAISGEWVGDKALPEMRFTLGTLHEAADPDVRMHLAVGDDRTIEGFTSWMPVSENGEVVGWTLDLMRRRDEGFRPVMEFLIGGAARQFNAEGYRFLSLSAAPLAQAPTGLDDGADQPVLQKLLDFLGATLEPYYGFQSLFRFKQKFHPEHHPLYLVFPDETALLEVGLAVVRAYVPDAGVTDWVAMGWEMVGPNGADAR